MAKAPLEKSRHLQISLNELEVFLEVAKTQSIRETARRFHSEPGQISRLIKRLEFKVGKRLIERSPSGVALTQEGTSAVDTAISIIRQADEFAALARDEKTEHKRFYGIGSTSFLSARLLAPVAGKQNDFRLRLLDVAPNQMIPYALKGAFDLALHMGALDWPRSWQAQEIGVIKWQLFARKGTKLPQRCSVQTIKAHTFVLPIYWTNEGLVEGDDQCPLRPNQRKQGIATSTAEAALGVLKSSDHVAFLPEILARDSVQSGEIVPIQVKEWKPVTKPLILAVRSDAVPNRLFNELAAQLSSAL